jgi:hypothetical protein
MFEVSAQKISMFNTTGKRNTCQTLLPRDIDQGKPSKVRVLMSFAAAVYNLAEIIKLPFRLRHKWGKIIASG